jgi:hypothetical protein
MTAVATGQANATFDIDSHRPNWREKRRLTRELRRRDETSARLAELYHLAEILNEAADLISGGWLQHSWFAYRDDSGRTKTVTASNAKEMAGREVVGACLVGAIVEAGGGLSQVRAQPVQRALDITWLTLFQAVPRLNHWTPAPEVRKERVRDLTRWNDQPSRTAHQAEALLRRSATAAESEAADISRRTTAVF